MHNAVKRPENIKTDDFLLQKNTTGQAENLLLRKPNQEQIRNKNNELKTLRLKEHILARGTFKSGLAGQSFVLRRHSLGSLRNLSSSRGRSRDSCRASRSCMRLALVYLGLHSTPPHHLCHSLNCLGQLFPTFVPKKKKKGIYGNNRVWIFVEEPEVYALN